MTPFEDLALLRAFVRIVESGNISAAARTHHIPQPTLSRYLSTLEERCGASLLRRDTHGMNLTETGHRLLTDARAMLALAEESGQRLRDERTVLRGHLHVFGTIDGGQFMVTRLIARFLELNPGVTAELSYSNRPVHMIQEGCDAGVVAGPMTDEGVVALPAAKIVRYLVAAPRLVESRPAVKRLADLKSWPWLALSIERFGAPDKVVLFGPKRAEQTLPIAPVLTSEGVTSLREAARAGLGISVLPDWLVREDVASGRLVRILPRWNAPEFPIHVIYQRERILPARVRAFVDFAVKHTGEMQVGG